LLLRKDQTSGSFRENYLPRENQNQSVDIIFTLQVAYCLASYLLPYGREIKMKKLASKNPENTVSYLQ
jgi:hypothetical protein